MNSLEQNLRQVRTIVNAKTIQGTNFVGVRNYTNSKNEVSNQTFLVGIDYIKLLRNDFDRLRSVNLGSILSKYDNEVVMKGYQELLTSLAKRISTEVEKDILRSNNDQTIKRSDSQVDAYVSIGKGLKSKDNDLYLYGLQVRKEILVSGTYPVVKSREKTIIKKDITKLANLRGNKFRLFKLGNIESLNIKGITI